MAQTQYEVMINFRSKLNKSVENLATKFQEINASSKAMSEQLKVSGQSLNQAFAASEMKKNISVAKQLMKETGLEANALSIGLKRMGITLKGGKMFNAFGQQIKKSTINMKKLKAASVQFKMSLLSVMFAGMALQRSMGQALRSMITTYQKANEDSEGLGKSTWHLLAAWEFLKYSIIDALTQSPLFKLLVEWVLQLINWLNKLPQSAKAFIAIGIAVLFVLGGLMVLIGQVGLFVNGLAAMGIGNTIISTLGASFWWLAVIIAAVVILWISDLGNFREFFEQTFGLLWVIVKLVFKHMLSIIKNTLTLIRAIFKGDFDKIYEIIINMWKRALIFQLKIFLALAAAGENLGILLTNVFVDIGQFGVNALIAAVNALIRQMNRVKGINIREFEPFDLSYLKRTYTTIDDIKDRFEKINSKIGLEEIMAEPTAVSTDTTSTGKQVVDNSTKNIELNFTMPEGVTDIDSLTDKVIEKMNDSFTQLNDSTS